ncbi:MAG: SURF1 family protein [Shewanella vesiculosa]|jgi:surfeit locus 1 family protein|nr:SURF1 family protein [Shewanella sp. SR43-8]MBB1476059.1 SURF1 family protein [Shewanella sp. SG41-3]NCO72356.1 SURF1 family protein [Shewanella vesiculosa]NCQ46459.1 SURF1 family protein [Shewanella frigidimarina]PIQ00344.1 MAG: cytochrome C oxidase biogenesis protein [Shewanella sp. CG18_big_fil_WC_8_21_14_2_50_42_11]PIX70854.1 MAG: SURF1 family protein [Shewanella sp. CG_4_10_14_3_um_filter_42_91]PIY66348.1 MAG: SURF1 family protein [Shewanella sp. CG_4_10_14_0_8_um_filter_42_13]PJB907|tara:strand:- start:5472 stop:6293 length:822 start_codon:yes stop_codon:yes gene_type:complete
MNTSNETKTNLTMKGVVTGNPFRSVGVSRVLFVMITLVVFGLLVKLGLWQLSRAAFKQEWQSTLLVRQQQHALNYEAMLALVNLSKLPTGSESEAALLTGYRLSILAKPVNNTIMLLDNQVYQGQVGYLAYQVFEITPEQPWILVELGFVAANKDRRILPQLEPLEIRYYTLYGRVYQKQTNPFSDQLDAEQRADAPIRFQNINTAALADMLEHSLIPVVLQPENVPRYNLPQPWVPIPLSAQKHQGYALQWFTMAGVFLGLMSWIAYRQYRR